MQQKAHRITRDTDIKNNRSNYTNINDNNNYYENSTK